jgi:hypothetical protein
MSLGIFSVPRERLPMTRTLAILIGLFFCLLAGCGSRPEVADPGKRQAEFFHDGKESSCALCHEKDRPQPALAVAHGKGDDCVKCHSSHGWKDGVLPFTHKPDLASCVECHSTNAPAGLVKRFDHSYKQADCVDCHGANLGQSWSGGQFDHHPSPEACVHCHAADLPPHPAPRFDHRTNGKGDCVSCHQAGFFDWKGGRFPHLPVPAACQSCHAIDLPQQPIHGFDHGVSGKGDCVSCHLANEGTAWKGGIFPHQPAPTECRSCHIADLPSGTVPDKKNGFDHKPVYGQECGSCHESPTNARSSWKGGFFGHNNNDGKSFTNCSPCHDNYDHYAGDNCSFCHKITWPTRGSKGEFGDTNNPQLK